jgi:citrate synthase
VLGDVDYIGLGVLVTAVFSGLATLLGVINGRTAKDAAFTAHEVKDSTDALHVKVDDKLNEHARIVTALEAISRDADARSKVAEDYISHRKELHP